MQHQSVSLHGQPTLWANWHVSFTPGRLALMSCQRHLQHDNMPSLRAVTTLLRTQLCPFDPGGRCAAVLDQGVRSLAHLATLSSSICRMSRHLISHDESRQSNVRDHDKNCNDEDCAPRHVWTLTVHLRHYSAHEFHEALLIRPSVASAHRSAQSCPLCASCTQNLVTVCTWSPLAHVLKASCAHSRRSHATCSLPP